MASASAVCNARMATIASPKPYSPFAGTRLTMATPRAAVPRMNVLVRAGAGPEKGYKDRAQPMSENKQSKLADDSGNAPEADRPISSGQGVQYSGKDAPGVEDEANTYVKPGEGNTGGKTDEEIDPIKRNMARGATGTAGPSGEGSSA